MELGGSRAFGQNVHQKTVSENTQPIDSLYLTATSLGEAITCLHSFCTLLFFVVFPYMVHDIHGLNIKNNELFFQNLKPLKIHKHTLAKCFIHKVSIVCGSLRGFQIMPNPQRSPRADNIIASISSSLLMCTGSLRSLQV